MATDILSYVKFYPPREPNESCHDYAKRIVESQFGKDDHRAIKRGPTSAYSKIKKNCERGG